MREKTVSQAEPGNPAAAAGVTVMREEGASPQERETPAVAAAGVTVVREETPQK